MTRNFTQVRELLETTVGQRVELLEVRGVNSLKTVDPAPNALAGQRILEIIAKDPCVEIRCDSIVVRIDLARTGTVDVLVGGGPETTATATGVIKLEGDTTIVFKEPARTKRITFGLTLR